MVGERSAYNWGMGSDTKTSLLSFVGIYVNGRLGMVMVLLVDSHLLVGYVGG